MLMCLQFDKFLLCPDEKVVMCGEVRLDIRGKDFEVLHLLLRNPKRLVRKETFLQDVWNGLIVEEANIAVCIANIRKFLGAYSKRPLIETVWGEGYRLLVDVVEVNKEVRQSDIQPEMHSNSVLAQHHKNKASELQAQQYNAALNDSGMLTDKIWYWARVSTITMSVVFLCIGALYYLNSTSETFYFKPFFPSLVFFGTYVVIELVRAFIAADWSMLRKTNSNTQQQEAEQTAASLQQVNIEHRERAELETTMAEQVKASYQNVGAEIRNRCGYEVGEMEIEIVIRDSEGACHVRWAYRNIKKTHPDITLSHIPGKLFFTPPDSSFTKWPTLSVKDERKYEIEFLRQDSNLCEFHVKVKDLTDSTISFEYTSEANKAFYMSEEKLAAQQSYPFEWFGIGATFAAIERLIIKIYFPKGYYVSSINADACIGLRPSGISDRTEVDRIRNSDGFIRDESEASLVVEQPKFGYIYFLRWKPLPVALVKSISH